MANNLVRPLVINNWPMSKILGKRRHTVNNLVRVHMVNRLHMANKPVRLHTANKPGRHLMVNRLPMVNTPLNSPYVQQSAYSDPPRGGLEVKGRSSRQLNC